MKATLGMNMVEQLYLHFFRACNEIYQCIRGKRLLKCFELKIMTLFCFCRRIRDQNPAAQNAIKVIQVTNLSRVQIHCGLKYLVGYMENGFRRKPPSHDRYFVGYISVKSFWTLFALKVLLSSWDCFPVRKLSWLKVQILFWSIGWWYIFYYKRPK